MKKFSRLIFFLVMAVIVLSLSGCGSDSDGDSGPDTKRLMVITSPVFNVGGSYRFYRGSNISVRNLNGGDFTAKYYVAPISDVEAVTLNLEFAEELSEDLPFMFTTADNDTDVLLYYNPSGEGNDTSTEYGRIMRFGGSSNLQKHTGLTVQGASVSASDYSSDLTMNYPVYAPSIEIDTTDEKVIVLNADTNTATIQGEGAVPSYNYVWHADPNHKDEYFTLEGSLEELTEAQMKANITESIYINRDIRYMPNTLNFDSSYTAQKDEDTEYVVYYSDAISTQMAEEYGEGFEGPYIFATLPQTMTGPEYTSDIPALSTMTHSAEDAYNNPVLHINEPGVFRLKGTWNGQIWLDPGVNDDVAVILDSLNVSCDVAPAIVFHNVRECGPTSDVVSFDVADGMLGDDETKHAGAIVVIADGSTNNIYGSNVYRILKPEKKNDEVEYINGSDISAQKKLYKMDGAFYSFASMVIAAESEIGAGRLNITSTTYEGIGNEMHLTIDSGIINVNAVDDGINTDADDVSVFTLNGGILTVVSSNGDGIDSNGYVVLNAGSLDITAAQDNNKNELNTTAGEGPIDAAVEAWKSSAVTYTHRSYAELQAQNQAQEQEDSGSSNDTDDENNTIDKSPVTIRDNARNIVLKINYTTPEQDTDTTTPRTADPESEVFVIEHKVNSFSGVKGINDK